jgi:SAM-dependent methyltransferase
VSSDLGKERTPLRFLRPSAGKLGYGIDEPRSILQLAIAGALAVVIGFVVTAYTDGVDPSVARLGLLVGPAVGFLILAVAAALYWSSRQGKVSEMTRIVSNIPWGGEEVVLEVGCGRGLGMVLAGRRLTTGYAVGVDLWRGGHLSGNDPSSIWANATKEGVRDKVFAIRADPRYLPFADSSVDAVLSAVSIHRLVRRRDRRVAFSEMQRVLRAGGRVGILEAGNGGPYSSLLRSLGMIDVSVHRLRFSSFPPFHVVRARKPFSG